MAFPWLSECTFDDGTSGHFDTESDGDSRLDFPHYGALSKVPGDPIPYRGAYCARVDLSVGTTDAYLQETGSWDTALDGTIYFRFYFYVSSDITMTDTNEFGIFQLWSATNTVEGGAYINYTTANGLRIGIGETSASSFKTLTTDKWHCLELFYTIDDGASNDGSVDAWLDGSAFTQVGSLDQGAITSGVIGVVGQDAGTTVGKVYFDQVVADDARIFPFTDRWSQEMTITQSQHVALGNCIVDNVTLIDGGSGDCVLRIFDTDTGYTSDESNVKVHLSAATASDTIDPAGMPVSCHRGAYVLLAGTNPKAVVKLRSAVGFGSEGAIRNIGVKRTPHYLGA